MFFSRSPYRSRHRVEDSSYQQPQHPILVNTTDPTTTTVLTNDGGQILESRMAAGDADLNINNLLNRRPGDGDDQKNLISPVEEKRKNRNTQVSQF